MLQHSSSLDVVMLMIYLQCLLTSIGFLFCYEFVTKSIFWHSNVSMSSDLLTWKVFSLPINLNETSDQLLKDCLKNIVLNSRLMDVVPILLLVPSFWNDLPIALRFEDDLTCFKSSLKNHLFTLFTKNPDSYVYWYAIFYLYIYVCDDIGQCFISLFYAPLNILYGKCAL